MLCCFGIALLCASTGFGCDRVSQVFDIPRLAGITIDGRSDDWPDGAFRANALSMLGGGLRPVDDFDARMRLGWDERGLLALITVRDDVGYEAEPAVPAYRGDSVNLYFADRRHGDNMITAMVSPGIDSRFPDVRVRIDDHRKSDELTKIEPRIEVGRLRITSGCQMEMRLPWQSLGIGPRTGAECGSNIRVNDHDIEFSDLTVAMWYPQPFSALDTSAMHGLRPAEQASDPVEVAARVAYCLDLPGTTRIQLAAPARFVGQSTVVQATPAIGEGTFQMRDGRAVAMISAPSKTMSQRRKDALTRVLVDGKQVGTLDQELIPGADSLLLYNMLGTKIPRTMKLLATSTPEKRHKVKILLMYGQSIIAQEWWGSIGSELRARFPYADLTVMSKSIGGYQVPMLLRTAEANVYPEYPGLIIFDAYHRYDGSLEALLRNIRSRTTAEVMLLTHHVTTHGLVRIADNLTVRELAVRYGCELVEMNDQWRDRTGRDGAGNSKTRFVSDSGRVVIESGDWGLTPEPWTVGLELTWNVIPQFVDAYRAPTITDPSREHVTILAQGLKPGKHVLEILSNGDGNVPITELRIHQPPLR
jgi:hypothetical protein